VRKCEECGSRLPRPLEGAGRVARYCPGGACRQRAYRRRGGRASGTTGAQRARRAAEAGEVVTEAEGGVPGAEEPVVATPVRADPVATTGHLW
jgi:hypothetical protein